ncbi:MAG: WHG domain-containing protein [Anaerolineae bacterium]|nr:WHG domain-containing protein [Anaerolineae bacterium]
MRNARAGLDYQAVIQAAALLADSEGLEKLSMANLAAQLGVQSPTLYHYVNGLTGLRRALTLYGLKILTTQLGREVMGKAGDDAVLALAQTMRNFGKEHPGLYAAVQTAPDPEDAEWLNTGREVVDIMIRALSAYKLSPEDAQHAIRMLRIIVDGTISLEKIGGFGLPLEVDETLRRLLVSLLDYLHMTPPK